MSIEFQNNLIINNLEQQVEYNKRNIERHFEIDRVLANFGIRIIGRVDTREDIDTQTPPPGGYEYGDAYAVGELGTVYDYYIYTRPFDDSDDDQWFDIGALQIVGPAGPKGPQGEKGNNGENTRWYRINTFEDLNTDELRNAPAGTFAVIAGYSNTDTGALLPLQGTVYYKFDDAPGYWEAAGSIIGPKGLQGEMGQRGPTGPQGPSGAIGPTGPRGLGLVILGNDAQLPLPSPVTVRRDGAYLVNVGGEKHLYAITGTGSPSDPLVWEDLGVYTLTSSGGGSTLYRHILNIQVMGDYLEGGSIVCEVISTKYNDLTANEIVPDGYGFWMLASGWAYSTQYYKNVPVDAIGRNDDAQIAVRYHYQGDIDTTVYDTENVVEITVVSDKVIQIN